jgi:acyl-CoA reductase-like NAD-dependent aldehyde dehydrogenase
MTDYKMYIGGRWVDSSDSAKEPVRNPYNGKVIGTVPVATRADVEAAVAAAVEAGPTMAKMPAFKRAEILRRTAELLKAAEREIATTIAAEAGKGFKFALTEARRAQETFTFAAEEAKRIHGETIPMDAATGGVNRLGFYLRVPIGVVAAISPFNFPLNLVAHKVAPALAAGCTVVLKPASVTPLTAVKLVEILTEAGLPPGALNLITGGGSTVGTWLTQDPRVAKVSFTGSPSVGRTIIKNAGLKKVTMELGNNSATIIDRDANLDKAIPACVVGAFSNSGQVCISVQRIYVHRDIYDSFRDRFVDAVKKLKVGDPLEEDTDVGPLITEKEAIRVEEWVNEAAQQGAKILTGGKREGGVYAPTVLDNVRSDMKVMCDEVFGPLVSLVPFDDFDRALDMADDSQFGLQAGVYTNDLTKAFQAVQRLNVGGVIINDVPAFRADHMPYGGNKESGIGREGPRFAIEDMTTIKMVVIRDNKS